MRLFLLGLPLRVADAEAAVDGPGLGDLERAGLVEAANGEVRATIKLVPHGDLLIASDADHDRPLDAEWVAGIHPPSATLAKLTVRRPVGRALDVATGNGIQALLASRHAEHVVATDLNPRALAFAALNARLNGVSNVELREGSFFEPVAGERFDLIVSNPPYVISPESRYLYRDSTLEGDGVAQLVLEQAPEHLADGGFAQALVSWGLPRGGDWLARLAGWVEGRGCDALFLHFGTDDPVTHASSWLRAEATDDPAGLADALDRWLAYLAGLGIEEVCYGAAALRRRADGGGWTRGERVVLETVEQAGDHVARLFAAHDLVAAGEAALLAAPLGLVDSHRLEQTSRSRDGALRGEDILLSLDDGLAFRIALDVHTAELLPLLDGRRPLRRALAARSEALGLDADEAARFEAAALPAVRRLLELGFLASSAG